ncbi:CPBP family intramembrane glutamic endopeptidase [Lysobacter tyrosinilyticus]
MLVALGIGLAISLAGILLFQISCDLLHIDSLRVAPRSAFWLLALSVLAIAALEPGLWFRQMGVQIPTWPHAAAALLAILAKLASTPILLRIQRAFGGVAIQQTERFQRIRSLSISHQLYIVITAAVTEEILYRGYAIGIGRHLLGSLSIAIAASLGAFVISHFRWGASHLFPVFVSGLILSILFVATADLSACILAHVGFIVGGHLLRVARPNNSFKPKPLRGSA